MWSLYQIIRRARHAHLLKEYSSQQPPLATVMTHLTQAMQVRAPGREGGRERGGVSGVCWFLQPFREKARSEADPDKQRMLQGVVVS